MSLIRIDHNPSRGQRAVFGVLWLVGFGVLGSALAWRGHGLRAAAVAWLAAVAVPAAGCVVPGLMRIVYVGMAYLALPLGLVVSHAVLAAVFYLLLAPMGLAMRMLGYDPMNRRFDKQAESYWVPRDANRDVSRYFRQF